MPSYVITGTSRGIGLEFVRQLSAQPDNTVFGLVRNLDTANTLLELAKAASNVHILQADIVDSKALKGAADEVAKVTGGSLDYLINNAVFQELERRFLTWDTYPEEFIAQDIHKSIEVNVVGVIYTVNAFLPLLRKSSIKKVLTLSSAQGDVDFALSAGIANAGSYSISKAALNVAMAKYAVQFKEEGVLFLTINPGMVNTFQPSAPPPPAVLEEMQKMKERVQRLYPNWDGKAMEPEESVRMQLEVLEKATMEDSGRFVSHHGNRQWL